MNDNPNNKETPFLHIPYIAPNQSQKEIIVNNAFDIIDNAISRLSPNQIEKSTTEESNTENLFILIDPVGSLLKSYVKKNLEITFDIRKKDKNIIIQIRKNKIALEIIFAQIIVEEIIEDTKIDKKKLATKIKDDKLIINLSSKETDSFIIRAIITVFL